MINEGVFIIFAWFGFGIIIGMVIMILIGELINIMGRKAREGEDENEK